MFPLALDKKQRMLAMGLLVFSILAVPYLACDYHESVPMPHRCVTGGANCLTNLGSVFLFPIIGFAIFGFIFSVSFVPLLAYPFFRPPRSVSFS